jgi:hypothetical protein
MVKELTSSIGSIVEPSQGAQRDLGTTAVDWSPFSDLDFASYAW